MKYSEETLMAYADGELDPVERAEIEAAMKRDPAVAAAVERHCSVAARIRSAYDGVLQEPVPGRLSALVDTPVAAGVSTPGERRARHGA